MRRLTQVAVFFAATTNVHAADLTVTSRVDAVTVFLSGAEVTRAAKVSLEKGTHTLTIADVPASAVPGSIRVEGAATGKLEITSVDTRRALLSRADAAAADAERKTIEDAIEALRDQKAISDAAAAAAETQRTLVTNLAQLPVRPAPASGQAQPEDWTRVLSIIAQATGDAAKAAVDAQVKGREIERKIEDLEKKLSSLAPAKSEQTEVKVFLSAATPLEADLIIRYQVANASWTPLYDARLKSGSKTEPAELELARRASITQRSGETWDNAAVQLSTVRPAAGTAAPELVPQTVDFEPEFKPQPVAKAKRMEGTRDAAAPAVTAAREQDEIAHAGAPPPPAEPLAIEETAAETTVAPFEATFSVPGRIAVPGTGEAKRVVLATEKYDPQLSCRTAPRSDAHAFLYAKFALGKGTPLLPGQVYLFRDGTFIGTGSVPLLSPGEDHELGFGIDDMVKVRFAVVDEQRGESGIISSFKTDVRNFRVTVKNLHERSIALTMLDQLPSPSNQEIKVEFTGRVQPTKMNVKDKRGVFSFETKLDADEERVFDYGYRVTWPAARSVTYGQQ